jgi:ABC-type nitrate/sulfonate/bicarbonate transport system substrate-binding protein
MKRMAMMAGTAAVLAAAAAPGTAQTLPVIRLGTGLAEEKELVYYAQDRGFFKQAGLDVQITVMSDGGAARPRRSAARSTPPSPTRVPSRPRTRAACRST